MKKSTPVSYTHLDVYKRQGGTIAARPGDMGLAPQVASSSLLGYVSELSNHYEIEARDILSMDSSNIRCV